MRNASSQRHQRKAQALRNKPNSMKAQRNSSAGFTLIEVLTYMAILGILLKTAVPHFDPRREQTNNAVETFVSNVRFARYKAMVSGTNYCLHWKDEHRYEIHRLKATSGGGWTNEKTVKTITIPSHITWTMQTQTGSHLQFNTRGMQVAFTDPNSPAVLTTHFSDTMGASHDVTIWPSGQAYEQN
jgi:prepilin-type N-terminal cleavage/methylation domain-containing protein